MRHVARLIKAVRDRTTLSSIMSRKKQNKRSTAFEGKRQSLHNAGSVPSRLSTTHAISSQLRER